MAKNKRKALISFIWGMNGTGKSTFVQKILEILNERTIIVTYQGDPVIWRNYEPIDPADKKEMASFTGYRQVFFRKYHNDTFKLLSRNFRKGAIVFDDCGSYLPINLRNNEGRGLKELAVNTRHNMVDLFFIGHSSKDIPRNLWSHYDRAFIGATDMNVEKNLPLTRRHLIMEAQEKVNMEFERLYTPTGTDHYGLFYQVKKK